MSVGKLRKGLSHMAQMPASYLEEKIGSVENSWSVINRQTGIIELDRRTRLLLAGIAENAQAIIDEINQWTGVDA